jgi:hypothetical protein
MPPFSFVGMILDGSSLPALRAKKLGSLGMFDPDIDPVSRPIQLDLTGTPGGTQVQKRRIEIRIFHFRLLSDEKPEDITVRRVQQKKHNKSVRLPVGPGEAVEIAQRFPRACGIPKEFQAIVEPAKQDPHERQARQIPQGKQFGIHAAPPISGKACLTYVGPQHMGVTHSYV